MHKITYEDIQYIADNAKIKWVDQGVPMNISGRVVIGTEPAHVAWIESVLAYLAKNQLLSEPVKIDHDNK